MNVDLRIRAIRTEEQYREYLSLIDQLMDVDPDQDSDEGQLLQTLVILVEDYENKRGYELPATVDPVETIRLRMEELGLKQSDLVSIMGDKSTVSKILSGKRKLTYDMIGPLSVLLKVPADALAIKSGTEVAKN